MKKTLRYLSYTIRDCLHFMPIFPIVVLVIQFITMLFYVWQPMVIAEIFEVIEELNEPNMRIFKWDIIKLCLICGLPSLMGTISEYFRIILEADKERFYGAKMFEHAKRIKLETMEDLHTLNTFQKAEELIQIIKLCFI